jgi:multiple sugar transport system permease protein
VIKSGQDDAKMTQARCSTPARAKSSWTPSLGLASFRSMHHVDWNLVYAATMLSLVPTVVVFFFAQKAFVQGVTLTGVKG